MNQNIPKQELSQRFDRLTQNQSELHDSSGRLHRWVFVPTDFQEKGRSCCGKENTAKDLLAENIEFVRLVNRYNSQLFTDIETRRKAMQNWKKLRILLVLLKICGGKFDDGNLCRSSKELLEYHNDN